MTCLKFQFFRGFGTLFGNFMCSDEATEKKVFMDMDRIMVRARRSLDIIITLCVCINGERFRERGHGRL